MGGDKEVEANSIIELLLLGARCGSSVEFRIKGRDKEIVERSIKELIEGNFGEKN